MWIPIYYYITKSQMTVAQAIQLIRQEPSSHPNTKKKLVERLSLGRKIAQKPSKMTEPFYSDILNDDSTLPDDHNKIRYKLKAVRCVKPDEVNQAILLEMIKLAVNRIKETGEMDYYSELRYAASHVDILLYADLV